MNRSANTEKLKYQFLLSGSLDPNAKNPKFDKKALLEGTESPEKLKDLVLLDGDFNELKLDKAKEDKRFIHMLDKHQSWVQETLGKDLNFLTNSNMINY